jgi:hypothetical protein
MGRRGREGGIVGLGRFPDVGTVRHDQRRNLITDDDFWFTRILTVYTKLE